MKSLAQKIDQCEGMLGTLDLNGWESDFIENMVQKLEEADGSTEWMTDAQATCLNRIYNKHFA
jgi:hypothetical protein